MVLSIAFLIMSTGTGWFRHFHVNADKRQ